MDSSVRFSKEFSSCHRHSPGISQRASKLTKHFKSELSPGRQLLPPIRDQVELLGVGQQHLLCSLPQVHCAVRVSQNQPVHHVGGVEGLHQPLLAKPFEAGHHIEVCRVHQKL